MQGGSTGHFLGTSHSAKVLEALPRQKPGPAKGDKSPVFETSKSTGHWVTLLLRATMG